MFRDEVAQGQAEKETELRERLGLVSHGRPELEGGRHRAVPTGATADDHDSSSTDAAEEGTT